MILERLKEYMDCKGIKIAAFERSIGMSNASFGKSLKNGKSIGTDKLENILSIYKDINPNWLLTGEGSMLREERPKGIIHEDPQVPTPKPDESILYNMYKDLMEEKKEKEKKIEKLTEELRAMERKVGSLEAELKHAATLGNRTAENASTRKLSSQSRASAHSASAPLNE